MTVTAVTKEMETVNQVKDMRVTQKDTQQLLAGMINNNLVNFQIDCGATYHVIPIDVLNPDTQIEQTDKVLVMYNKSKQCPVGKCKMKVMKARGTWRLRLSTWWLLYQSQQRG